MSKQAPKYPAIVKAIKVLDKYYQVNCPPDQYRALEEAALLLDDKMRHIRDSGKVIGVERIAIMAALNLAHDYLQNMDHRDNYIDDVNQQLELLENKVKQALRFSDEKEI
ncbi:cell division protein ZapA [Piscirickettsia litoralis]|uniref:Cell division protein ZapA n=1 Tax=Piscirickettsia litoralis TaxID=1891921 RepID=A0ABX3A4Z1_9GAMM|nr:cell division protein ZapA [Piscirickettsia litoralis]ODN42741.1 cell division protein ZapA [Piscirickettsia litoralis]